MKKTLSLILVVIMLVASVATVSVGAAATASQWDGTTKDTSWYNPESTTKTATIYNAAQLAGLAEISVNENFQDWTIKLGTDIVWNTGDASTYEQTAPANVWTPISDFWGTFDGQGHTVSGLYFNDDTAMQVGFFATLNGGTVKNLSVVNSYFCARSAIGAIAGQAHEYKVLIDNCYSDVIIHGYPMQKDKSMTNLDRAQAGGILGLNSVSDTTVSNCWTEGKYIAFAPWDGQAKDDGSDNKASSVGGVVGTSQKAIIFVKNCISSAYIEGHSLIGGIIGRMGGAEGSGSSIENCIFLGKLHITRERDLNKDGSSKTNVVNYTGSIVGINMKSSVTIKNCYALDTFAVTYKKEALLNKDFRTAFWSTNDTATANITVDSTMFSVSEASIKGEAAKTTLAGFDFTSIWAAGENGPEIAALSYIAKNKASDVPPSVPSDEPEQGGEVTPPTGGDETEDTGAADTEPVDTNTGDVNTGDVTTDTQKDTTPATQDTANADKGGCGSVIGASSVVAMAIVGAVAFVGKKKED